MPTRKTSMKILDVNHEHFLDVMDQHLRSLSALDDDEAIESWKCNENSNFIFYIKKKP